MEPHQQRVVYEKAALDENINKLEAFMLTPIYDGLPSDEQSLLYRQLRAMKGYSGILGERITAF